MANHDYLLITRNNIERLTCVINKVIKYYLTDKTNKKMAETLVSNMKKELKAREEIILPMTDDYFTFFAQVDALGKDDHQCYICKNYFRCSTMNRR